MPTPRLSLPYIVQSQAQKEVTHAEGLNILDALVQAAVETRSLSVPPGSPVDGALYLVGATPTGAWAGHANALAQWIGGAWAFHPVAEGFRAWIKDEDALIVWTGSAWLAYTPAAGAVTFTLSADFAVSPTIAGALYRCDANAGAITAGLPPLADAGTGFEATLRRVDGSANAVTLMPAHNLIARSEAFDDAVWVKSRLSVQANAGFAPDGVLDADKLIEDTTTGNHELRQDFTKAEGETTLIVAVAAKPAFRSQLYLMLDDGASTNRAQIRVDLTGGTVEYSNAAGTVTLDASGVIDLGLGWRLLWLAATLPAAAGTYAQRIRLYDGASSSYLGDGTSGVLLSRAQLCCGASLTSYLETADAPIQETIGGAASYALSSQTESVVLTAAASEWTAVPQADPAAGAVTLGNASASAADAIAIGEHASASGIASLALGETASATAENAIAIGDATASAGSAIAIGESAGASNTSAIAIGDNAGAAGVDCVAIGHAASLSGNYNVGIGYNAKFAASQQYNIGIGYNVNPGVNADADFDQNVLIGREVINTTGTVQKNGTQLPSNNVLVGYRTISADGAGVISLGAQNILIGYSVAHHASSGTIAIGTNNIALGGRLCEIQNVSGSDALAVGTGTITLGAYTNRNTTGAVAINDYSIAIGYSSNRNAAAATNVTVGARSITIGYGNNYDSGGVIGDNAIALGSECDVSADSGIAIGRTCVVAKANAVALGKGQTVVNAGEFAFGPAASHGMVTYVLAATTTDASTVELTTDGTSFIAIPAGKVFCFEAFQTTWNRTDSTHQVCRFSGGLIRNSAGTVTLINAPIVGANTGAENQITFTADDTNDRLAVKITGKAGKTIETRVIVTGAFLAG